MGISSLGKMRFVRTRTRRRVLEGRSHSSSGGGFQSSDGLDEIKKVCGLLDGAIEPMGDTNAGQNNAKGDLRHPRGAR